jgi:hypothetical protein
MKLDASFIVWLAVMSPSLGACSRSDSAAEKPSWREPNLSLNPGYVLVYETMNAFSNIDKVLLIKKESEPFEEVIESVADYSGKLAEQLKERDEHDDEIDLEGESMPQVIGQARKEMGAELREKIGGPFKGATGSELERELLLSLDVGLSESHHVVRELARRESSTERHAILEDADKNLGELSRAVKRQLQTHHFCDRAGIDED